MGGVPIEIVIAGCGCGIAAWFVVRCLLMGFFTVDQSERAIKTSFGRASAWGMRQLWMILIGRA